MHVILGPMKPIVLSIAASLLLLTPAVAAGDDLTVPAAAPCPGGILEMGAFDYTQCMANWTIGVVEYYVCVVVNGEPNC